MASISTILDTLLEALKAAPEEQLAEEQRAELQAVLNRGREMVKAPVKKPAADGAAAGRPKKETLPPPPMPEGGEGAPDAADYRLAPSDIKEDVCVGRHLKSPDKRWSIKVFTEAQCGAEVEEDGLCKTCLARSQRFAADPKPGKWDGRVTEDPLCWQHMLGTAWAVQAQASGKLKWQPAVGGVTDSASVVSSSDSATSGKMSVVEAKAAAKVTKETEKAAAKAAKEAEKAAAKAAKEAEKAAIKAAKEAEKAAKEAEKATKAVASKPKPKAKAKAAAETAAVPAKADTDAEVVETDGELKALGGGLYWLKGQKLYNFDMATNSAGAYVGILCADGETIDKDAKEDESSDEE